MLFLLQAVTMYRLPSAFSELNESSLTVLPVHMMLELLQSLGLNTPKYSILPNQEERLLKFTQQVSL